jgi:hypothetical protein
MYAFIQKGGHVVWKNKRYTIMSKVSLRSDLYISQEDHVFIVNVMVTNLTKEKDGFKCHQSTNRCSYGI